MFKELKKLDKKMRKLEKRYDEAKGDVTKERIMKSFIATEKKYKDLLEMVLRIGKGELI